jgi:hypothetical protein
VRPERFGTLKIATRVWPIFTGSTNVAENSKKFGLISVHCPFNIFAPNRVGIPRFTVVPGMRFEALFFIGPPLKPVPSRRVLHKNGLVAV